ncbi:MAG TPA: TIGR03560 family F420-dependent LLM class oxidoreductase [Candidatus Limnocylindria bacterium]|nr:TIGR03560 family F420-dependent LLM class oxidoreductase [Candidatus Limnocylindria bacterium]
MKIGVIVPQGWTGEYDGWESQRAWARTVEVARQAERLGFESVWLFDHFHTVPRPTDEITFESFTSLAALAMATERVRIGQVVICNGFRNPALTAKMASTLDTISGGRYDLGIGAGWKREEWRAYGYGFPETKERLAMLKDALEILSRMREPGRENRATYEGEHASVAGAINQPKPVGPMPIMVGGNGPNVTWRLAARFADELNVDGMSPDELRDALPTIRSRCEEIGRDPATLAISVHAWWGEPAWSRPGERRVELLQQYAELGVSRVIGLLQASADGDEALERLAEDARAAGPSVDW